MAILFGASAAASAAPCSGVLNHTAPSLLGDQPQSLCQYQGKVVLVVNTASRCGYTPQYEGLEKVYKRYKDKGLVVLGFPANDFGGQEPGSNKDIAQFCEVNFGVSFPMFAKTTVVGPKADPLFAQLAQKTGKRPGWNFHKYLIDRSGEKVLSFDTAVEPGDPRLTGQIEKLLALQ